MADEWTRGPMRILPQGFARFCLTYRVRYGSGWRDFKMEKTAKIEFNTEARLAAELHARLETKKRPFEIRDVVNIGTEVPVDGGAVISEKKWEEIKAEQRQRFSKMEIEERARELGIWIPEKKKPLH